MYGVCIVVLCVMGSIQRRWDLRKTYWFTLLVSLLIENWTVTIVCWCFMHKLKPLFHFQNIQKLPLSHANGIFTNAHILISYSYSKTKWMCVVILISDLPPTESCSIYHSSGFYLSIVLCVVILVAVFFLLCFVSNVHNSTFNRFFGPLFAFIVLIVLEGKLFCIVVECIMVNWSESIAFVLNPYIFISRWVS